MATPEADKEIIVPKVEAVDVTLPGSIEGIKLDYETQRLGGKDISVARSPELITPERHRQLFAEAQARIKQHEAQIKEIKEAVPGLDADKALESDYAVHDIEGGKDLLVPKTLEGEKPRYAGPETEELTVQRGLHLGSVRTESYADRRADKEAEQIELEKETLNEFREFLKPDNILDLKWDIEKALNKELEERNNRLEHDSQTDRDALKEKTKNEFINRYLQTGMKNGETREVPDIVRQKVAELVNLSYDKLSQQEKVNRKAREDREKASQEAKEAAEKTEQFKERAARASADMPQRTPSMSREALEAYVNEQLDYMAESMLDQEFEGDGRVDFRENLKKVWKGVFAWNHYKKSYTEEAKKELTDAGGDLTAVREKLLGESEEKAKEISEQALRAAIEQTLNETKNLYPFIQSQPELWDSVKNTVLKSTMGEIGGIEFNNRIKEAIEKANIYDQETADAILEDVGRLLEVALSARDYIEAGLRNEEIMSVIAKVETSGATERGDSDIKTRREVLNKAVRFLGNHFTWG